MSLPADSISISLQSFSCGAVISSYFGFGRRRSKECHPDYVHQACILRTFWSVIVLSGICHGLMIFIWLFYWASFDFQMLVPLKCVSNMPLIVIAALLDFFNQNLLDPCLVINTCLCQCTCRPIGMTQFPKCIKRFFHGFRNRKSLQNVCLPIVFWLSYYFIITSLYQFCFTL